MGNLGAQKEKRNDTPISAKKDKFQDYDFAFFVSDIECFTHEESWLSLFGELLFIQKPEDMELFPPDLDYGYSYIMYFKDGIKMDTFHVKYNTLDLFTTFHKSLMRVLYFTWKSAFLEPIDENFQLTSPYQDEI